MIDAELPADKRFDAIEELFQRIYTYAEENTRFQTDVFVDKIFEKFETDGDITDGQWQALSRICEKWGIE